MRFTVTTQFSRLIALILALFMGAFAGCGSGYDPDEEQRDDDLVRENQEWQKAATTPREERQETPAELFRKAYKEEQTGSVGMAIWLYQDAAEQGLEEAVPEFHRLLDEKLNDPLQITNAARMLVNIQNPVFADRSRLYYQCAYDKLVEVAKKEGFKPGKRYLSDKAQAVFATCSQVPEEIREIEALAHILGRPDWLMWRRHLAEAELGSECDGVAGGNTNRSFRIFLELGDLEGAKKAAKRIGNYDLLHENGFEEEARCAAMKEYAHQVVLFEDGWEPPTEDAEEYRPIRPHQIENINDAIIWAQKGGMTLSQVQRDLETMRTFKELEDQKDFELAEQIYKLLGDEGAAKKMALLKQ